MTPPLPTRTDSGYSFGSLVAEGLPPRQSQILLMRASGLSIKAIAQALQCSCANVQQGIKNLFFKLDAHSSPELITKAFANKTLRMLSLATAVFLGGFGAQLTDHNTIARLSRTRTTQHLRINRSTNRKTWC